MRLGVILAVTVGGALLAGCSVTSQPAGGYQRSEVIVDSRSGYGAGRGVVRERREDYRERVEDRRERREDARERVEDRAERREDAQERREDGRERREDWRERRDDMRR